jgi:hypothetical protein
MFLQFFEKYNYYANKMKNKEIPHNGWNNYVERDNIDTANTQMHDRSRSWLGTVTGDTASTQMHDRSRSWLGTVAGETGWFISDIEMTGAKLVELSKGDIEEGLGRMMEEHWTQEFKPIFIVKCAMQIGRDGFGISGPLIYSNNFFAGIKVHAII